MTTARVTAFTVFLACLTATHASAQTATDTHEWTRRLMLNALTGVATAPGDTGGILGAGAGWGIGRRWLIEGSGVWFDRPEGAKAFAATLTAQVMLADRRPVLPYLEIGAGMYAASYDPGQAAVPEFYARHLRSSPQEPPGGRVSSRDPSVVLGGGVYLLVGRNVGVRPEVTSMIVVDGGHADVVTAVAVRVSYHFETRAVTPARR